jgi:transglutaminase-like putative cysteine protease
MPYHKRQTLYRHAWRSFQSNTVEFDLSYDLSAPGDTQRISFVTLIPQTIPDRQTISSISYSPNPSRIFSRHGNRYAEFVFVEPDRHTEIKISVKAELFRYDLMTARTKGQKTPASALELARFLKQEKYIEKDHHLIRQIADGIEGETDIDIAKNIYEYVAENMEYTLSRGRGIGAVKALQRGEGDCTEYSDLFVAICRAKNVPARVVTGYTIRTDSKSQRHNWVEVYMNGYGWVPFDPASGDIRNVMIRGRAFSRMWPVYIYLSHIRNDYVLGRYGFAAYRYWGDRIRIKDSIEFK